MSNQKKSGGAAPGKVVSFRPNASDWNAAEDRANNIVGQRIAAERKRCGLTLGDPDPGTEQMGKGTHSPQRLPIPRCLPGPWDRGLHGWHRILPLGRCGPTEAG